MAYEIYFEAERREMSIPHDLSVVGFDNNFMCGVVQPGLTTMCQPLEVMGRHAVMLLLSMLKDKGVPRLGLTKFMNLS